MLGKNLIPVWIGILALSGMFLMGQSSWAPSDRDGDGLVDSIDPCIHDADCDEDGLIDGNLGSGIEDININGQVDPGETDPTLFDTDGDGLSDGVERGLLWPEMTVATDPLVFIADADPFTTTDPTDPDTDGDGISDGDEDVNGNGRVDEGETDPNDMDEDGCINAVDPEPSIPSPDGDGDGFGQTCDCNDGNANVYPRAPELCDGIENQCPGDAGYGEGDPGHGVVDEGCYMAQIPAGCFDMGDAFGEGLDHESPVHNVCISAFEMDFHEVTTGEYAECEDAGACTEPRYTYGGTREHYYRNPTYSDYPTVHVTWLQAVDYCTWVGKRLPSEAEWEYAARGGLASKRYPWGDVLIGTAANYINSGDPEDNDTNAVMSYPPNGFDLYDMAGNVVEWVNDVYQSDYYSVSPANDPPGPASGESRVMRGGSWGSYPLELTVSFRYFFPDYSYNVSRYVGFRCAR